MNIKVQTRKLQRFRAQKWCKGGINVREFREIETSCEAMYNQTD